MAHGTTAADEVAAAHRALAAAGQADMVWGHAAVRDPEGRGLWTKASGWGLEEITPERVVLLSDDGEVLAGDGPRHIEFHIHAALMRARPDVGATVHTHAEATVAFAALGVPLRPLSHDAVPFLAPDVVRFTGTSDLVATRALGDALATAIGTANGCLIPGHGMVTVGPDVATAVMHAALLERACRIQLSAGGGGGPVVWSSDADVAAKRRNLWTAAQLAAGYDYLVRTADRRFGDAAHGTDVHGG
ncbi:class II aldolase/adducin family protein [Pseudonocardia sp.]|uniref:class II aldolase/adducin family protein n=1 Tax=Pseudonocardia sp. TaxID=60912 RepID=UPI003D0B0AD4